MAQGDVTFSSISDHVSEAMIEGMRVRLVRRPADDMAGGGRVFVTGEGERYPHLAVMGDALPAPMKRGVDPANDEAYDAYNRHALSLMRYDMARVFAALTDADITPPVLTNNSVYSRFAGCTDCPCSPGFVLRDPLLIDGHPVDVHIDSPNETP